MLLVLTLLVHPSRYASIGMTRYAHRWSLLGCNKQLQGKPGTSSSRHRQSHPKLSSHLSPSPRPTVLSRLHQSQSIRSSLHTAFLLHYNLLTDQSLLLDQTDHYLFSLRAAFINHFRCAISCVYGCFVPLAHT